MDKAQTLVDFIEDLILSEFHGFTREQWREELSKQFPYNELQSIAQRGKA